MIWFCNIHVLHSCYWYEKPLQNLLAFICLLNFLCCWTAHHWVMRSGRRVGAFIMELYLENCHIFFLAETCTCIVFDRDGLTERSYRLLCWTFPSRGHSTTTWTEFCHFLTPLPLRRPFLYPKRGKKQTFFDPLPPSSCPRSYWRVWSKIYLKHRNIWKWL